MTFSLIMLGTLIILTAFNVGESLYKKLKIKKKYLMAMLIVTLVLYFVPGIKIFGVTLTWVGFILPLIFSVVVAFKVKNLKLYFKMFVCLLITFSLNMVYCLITFDVYESAIFQPYLALGVVIGTIPLFIAHKPTMLYASNFLGLIFAEIVFYVSRYAIYGEFYLTLGSRKVFEILIVAFVSSMIFYYLIRKVKIILIRRKIKQKNALQI